MIYDDINKDFLAARKARDADKAAFFSFIVGTIQNSKDVKTQNGTKLYTDSLVLALLKNLKKKLSEDADTSKQVEIDILDSYLPQMLTEDKLRAILSTVDGELKDKMQHLKDNYPFCYDGRLAAQIAKE